MLFGSGKPIFSFTEGRDPTDILVTIVLRTVLLYCFIILAIRFMGKRQIGDMQPGELVVTFLISDLAAAPILNHSDPLLEGIVPITVLVLLEWLVSKFILRSLTLRRLVDGHTAVLIRNGRIDQAMLRRLRITVDDLMELLRGQNVFDIETVAYGMLETNGDFSVLLKAEEQPLTPKTRDTAPPPASFPVPIVTDGLLRRSQMDYLGMDEAQVEQLLKKNGVTRKEVFLMTADAEGKTVVIKKEGKRKNRSR